MAFAIMRCKKLKSWGSLKASFDHAFREKETPNADPARTPDNTHFYARTADQAFATMRASMPSKVRKNAVLGVEYMMTASPEWWQTATAEQKRSFFAQSVDWLKHKYGEEHIITATIHADETTPHLTAVVIPIDERGRLNARSFIGGTKDALSRDQDSFADAVRHLGLERGVKGSKAKHTAIRQWYGELARRGEAVRKAAVTPDELKPRKLSWLWSESPEAVAERISKRLAPELARAQAVDGLKAEARQLRQGLTKSQQELAESQRELSYAKAQLDSWDFINQTLEENMDLKRKLFEAMDARQIRITAEAQMREFKRREAELNELKRQQEAERREAERQRELEAERQRQAEAREQRERDSRSRSSGWSR